MLNSTQTIELYLLELIRYLTGNRRTRSLSYKSMKTAHDSHSLESQTSYEKSQKKYTPVPTRIAIEALDALDPQQFLAE